MKLRSGFCLRKRYCFNSSCRSTSYHIRFSARLAVFLWSFAYSVSSGLYGICVTFSNPPCPPLSRGHDTTFFQNNFPAFSLARSSASGLKSVAKTFRSLSVLWAMEIGMIPVPVQISAMVPISGFSQSSLTQYFTSSSVSKRGINARGSTLKRCPQKRTDQSEYSSGKSDIFSNEKK